MCSQNTEAEYHKYLYTWCHGEHHVVNHDLVGASIYNLLTSAMFFQICNAVAVAGYLNISTFIASGKTLGR
ncbi:hypothetical protein LIER_18803 [Lithospermum erythrorhizon]|uniref:Uncharacterized protein n=1 Tax=Lithospermum erythrorhizon TaxID=34254 RepID=A0AAV3QJF0_LITER